MSVCIAAICNNGKSIVAASDEKITFGSGALSPDFAAQKNRPFIANWFALCAGNDSLHAPIVLSRAEKMLRGKELTAETVGAAVDDSLRTQLHRQIENQVLQRYGLTVETFLRDGKKQLSTTKYNAVCAQIDRIDLSLVFLLCGFDDENHAHILAVDGQDAVKSFADVGFAAIGEGDQAAFSALAFQISHKKLLPGFSSVENTVYCVCEAKFMAETASTVGQGTFVVVVDSEPRQVRFLTSIDAVRAIWEQDGAPRIPDSSTSAIGAMLKTIREMEPQSNSQEEKPTLLSPRRDQKSLPPSLE